MSAPIYLPVRAAERPLLGGANQPWYGVTAGATPVDAVGVANPNTYRVVYMVTLVNTTGGAIDVTWQVYDGTNTIVVAQQLALAAGAEFSRNWQGGLVLLGSWKLQVKLAGAGVVPASAHWADPLT